MPDVNQNGLRKSVQKALDKKSILNMLTDGSSFVIDDTEHNTRNNNNNEKYENRTNRNDVQHDKPLEIPSSLSLVERVARAKESLAIRKQKEQPK